MATVETTIKLSIPQEGVTLQALEVAVAKEVRQAGRELILAGGKVMEAQILTKLGQRVHRAMITCSTDVSSGISAPRSCRNSRHSMRASLVFSRHSS